MGRKVTSAKKWKQNTSCFLKKELNGLRIMCMYDWFVSQLILRPLQLEYISVQK